jgi:hypothetical protein
MKAKMSFIVGAVALTVASISAQAQVPITGQINFEGGATLDLPIPNATTFTSFFGPGPLGGLVVSVGGGLPDGSYTGIPATTAVTFAPSFDFASFSSPFQLWTFNALGQVYSFEVTSVTSQQQETSPFNYINIAGTGTGTITGGATTYLATPEECSICDQVTKTLSNIGFLGKMKGHCQQDCQCCGRLKHNLPKLGQNIAETSPSRAF